MQCLGKKGKLEIETVIVLVLGIVFLIVVIGIVGSSKKAFTEEKVAQVGCWMTNTIKCGGGPLSKFPSACSLEILDDGVNVETFAALLRGTWWEYKQGKCDMGIAGDEVYPVYAFVPQEDIKLQDFFGYIMTHNSNEPKEQVLITSSDYNYLEANTPGLTLCFDIADKDIQQGVLKKGKVYYINYFNDLELVGEKPLGDKILISNNYNFDKDLRKDMYLTIGAAAVGAAVAGGAIVATGGLALIPLGTFAVGGGLAGSDIANFAIEKPQNQDKGCLLYGFYKS